MFWVSKSGAVVCLPFDVRSAVCQSLITCLISSGLYALGAIPRILHQAKTVQKIIGLMHSHVRDVPSMANCSNDMRLMVASCSLDSCAI